MSKAISKSPGRGWVVTGGWRDADDVAGESNEGVCRFDDDAYEGEDAVCLRGSDEIAGWRGNKDGGYEDDADEEEEEEEEWGRDLWFKILEEEV